MTYENQPTPPELRRKPSFQHFYPRWILFVHPFLRSPQKTLRNTIKSISIESMPDKKRAELLGLCGVRSKCRDPPSRCGGVTVTFPTNVGKVSGSR